MVGKRAEAIQRRIEAGEKACSRCKIVKKFSEFARNKGRADGHTSACKDCISKGQGFNRRGNRRGQADIEADLRSGSKICYKCGERKEFSEFPRLSRTADGFLSVCKACKVPIPKHYRKSSHFLKKYNLTTGQYEDLFTTQGGLCKICNNPGGNRRLVVDHDHRTGRVRGLLCGVCNSLLGFAKDNVEVLRSAIQYLSHRELP